jgi:hypothetical protein
MKSLRSRRSFLLLALFAVSVATGADTPTAGSRPDPWKPLRILIGQWEGDVQGESGKGKAEREYRFVLNNRFIHVANKSIYPAQEKNPKGETHEDIGYISFDKAAKKLGIRQFHVEGFVNHYVIESISEDGRTLVFVTAAIENIGAGWRGRETYRIISDDEFVETFALAEPGKDFAIYSETRFRRKK